MNGAFDQALKPIAQWLEQELRAEIIKQGHVATGKLRDSVKVAVTGAGLTGYAGDATYARYVDWGRRPGKWVPIQALINWVQAKGIAEGDKAVSVAWAINHAIYKKGVPTSGNEAKTKFVTRTLEAQKSKIIDDIHKAMVIGMQIEMRNIVEQQRQEYKPK